jgi:hypothetical protein
LVVDDDPSIRRLLATILPAYSSWPLMISTGGASAHDASVLTSDAILEPLTFGPPMARFAVPAQRVADRDS